MILDDGTGRIVVQAMKQVEIKVGDLVDCLGELQLNHPRLKCQYVIGNHVFIVKDPNMETLRFLEIVQLYKECYFSGQSKTQEGVPPLTNALKTNLKRKFTTEALESNKIFVTSQKVPQEYYLTISSTEFERFVNGSRRLELRANKPPYAIMTQGDCVTLNGSYVTKIHSKRSYKDIAAVLAAENIELLLPQGITAANALPYYRRYINQQEENANGVVVLEIGNPPTNTMNVEDLSTIIYQQLESAGNGLSIEEIVSTCPQLTSDQITQALTNLQEDGIVYVANSRYLVV
ncbi:hypothetical protein THRCLA_07779 [Thraustotheca clavata]|uniref:Uncharacterized protein n=1 Tax=Thraustotheca clavata TaxID=74557 RepID=A0A1V9ZCG7_9STRA|nr:hypothetical protein THRCLA_07779 [Thraustotheca clavata]